ncbi:MAG: aminotransferase class V-fold PLP-dependent enzyme [Pirellulales bacterium]|nr:aminotransferase class V-fold PLP-dependent enzyme [Pirellulales bacterium]
MASALSAPSDASVVHGWFPTEQALLCYSVRSGLDLLLQALQLPSGSEVVVSAVTIPDMLRIIEHHGLTPVLADVDPATLEVPISAVENAITTKTRLVLVAHLFGSRIDMAPITRLAQQHGLLVVEDCAQAFVGQEYAGHHASDVSLFSFGPIKTATALGGGVVRVNRPELLQSMLDIQKNYPPQSRSKYLARIAKYAVLKLASYPWLYGILERGCRLLGINHDRWISLLGRNLTGPSLLANIRQRPCVALRQMLARRIQQFDKRQMQRRTRVGRYLTHGISGSFSLWTGNANKSHTYWVLAAKTLRAKKLIAVLRQAGYDATMRSSLCNGTKEQKDSQHSVNENWLAQTVFVPCDPAMPIQELRRLRSKLREVFY